MYHDPADRPASYNDLPHPEGKWEDNYGLKQRKYNAALAGSAIFLVGTILYVSHQIDISYTIRKSPCRC